MKRILIVSSFVLAATFLATSSSSQAQSPIPVQAATKQVTAKVTPRRDRFSPHRFTTTGRVVPPPFCPPAVAPTEGGPCVGLLIACPPGTNNPLYCGFSQVCPPGTAGTAYCVNPPASVLCRGKVRVTFQRVAGRLTISSRRVDLRPDCTYRSQVTFRVRLRQRRGPVDVRAVFEGNALLQSRTSPRQRVRIG